jgi:hypothetical protein
MCSGKCGGLYYEEHSRNVIVSVGSIILIFGKSGCIRNSNLKKNN